MGSIKNIPINGIGPGALATMKEDKLGNILGVLKVKGTAAPMASASSSVGHTDLDTTAQSISLSPIKQQESVIQSESVVARKQKTILV